MPTTFARTAASSVRGCTMVRRHTTALTVTAPSTMTTPSVRPSSRNVRPDVTARAAADSAITSGPIENEPRHQRNQEPQTGIDEQERAKMRLELGKGEDLAHECGDGDPHHHAKDPCRHEGALDVDDGIAPSRRNGRHADGDESQQPSPFCARPRLHGAVA